jgi:hypothetical protein
MSIFCRLLAAGTCLVGFSVADRALAQSTPLPPGQVVIGPIGNTDGPTLPSLTTGYDANVYTGSVEGGFIPTAPATVVRTAVPTQFVRFYHENYDNTLGPAVGPWIATSNSVRGLTSAQVKNILALPDLPTSVTLVQVPAGTCVLGGPGNPALGNFPANPPSVPTPGPWGAAGAPQYYIVGQTSALNCINPQDISPSNYITKSDMGAFALAYGPNAGFGNSAAVAMALDHAVFPAPFTSMDSVYNSLDVLNFADPPQLRSALSQLSGEVNADLVSASLASGSMFLNSVRQRLREGTGPSAAGASAAASAGAALAAPEARTWFNGWGGHSSIAGNADSHGFSSSFGAAAAGLDYQLYPNFKLGGAVGYTHATFSTSGLTSSGNAGNYYAALYGSYTTGPLYIDLSAGYGLSDFTLNRAVAFPGQQGGTIGQTQSQAFLSSAEMGYQFEVASATLFTPTVGLQTIALRQDAFSEYGAGPLNLNVDGKNLVATRSLLGTDLRRSFSLGADGLLEASLRLAWAHDFAGTDRSIAASFQELPSAAFVVHGAQPTRDAAVIGVGLSLDGPAEVFVRYDGLYSGNQQAHSGTAGLSSTF